MKQRVISFSLLALTAAVAFAGCSSGNGPATGGTKTPETTTPASVAVDTKPVTLKMFFPISMSDTDFTNLVVEPVKKKYPYITVEMIKRNNKPTALEQLQDIYAVGDSPDLLFTWNGDLPSYKDVDLLYDMTDLAKKHGVDTGKFEPVVLDSLKVIMDNKGLPALPFAVNFNATYYNKDLFDRFGIGYPKDGMTWNDAIELAKKVSRTDGGVQYMGLSPDTLIRLAMPLSLTKVDAKTQKATMNNDSWKRVFELQKEIYSIPNNMPKKMNDAGQKSFLNEKTLAMLPTINLMNLGLESAQKEGLNWDIVQYPSYPDKPNTYGHVDTHLVAIAKTSKNKDQAMQVIEVMTSDEVQLLSTRTTARMTALKNKDIKNQFGAEMTFLKGKNIPSIMKSNPAPGPLYSQFESRTNAIALKKLEEFVNGKDINTTLREADEEIHTLIGSSAKK
ncbi:ABC transporter substrate-binding protein [Paenibacillus oceani]|uniref:Extracellular solute-binding protein n=1 Tax=Paenibacillus oceani TaxID=2772510 RepID=A0A927H3G1_9BACL|nr:extracellular solute-binding protein [Paenibacillus oceani]MBD2866825.1 extracellular solute-binding protein [Paenibacillus oceani]